MLVWSFALPFTAAVAAMAATTKFKNTFWPMSDSTANLVQKNAYEEDMHNRPTRQLHAA